ncbi:hypothetical protein [Streptomyces sp. SJL17-1]|uniref:hypothetical protein n=1 Tax=Streptomyces sp. SJL17-1 TaxID=2967223 RepID=UPI0029668568|nr:hypothetical protein [Streptomyces sp. SJL17-1]
MLLADGSEPGPVYFDLSSGSFFHESIGWWHYDGTMRRPTSTSMRGRCACGWRGEKTYPIDWEKVHEDDDPDVYDTSGPYGDWALLHMDDVADRALKLPEDLAGLLAQVRERLDRLLDEDEYVTVIKVADELEELIAGVRPGRRQAPHARTRGVHARDRRGARHDRVGGPRPPRALRAPRPLTLPTRRRTDEGPLP